jgi:hypothetical protein
MDTQGKRTSLEKDCVALSMKAYVHTQMKAYVHTRGAYVHTRGAYVHTQIAEHFRTNTDVHSHAHIKFTPMTILLVCISL